jgi:hypothetical protein
MALMRFMLQLKGELIVFICTAPNTFTRKGSVGK